jgi:hypothetical protein
MTPTADDRGGSLFRTRREAGFYFGMENGIVLRLSMELTSSH